MSLNAATIEYLLAKGLSASDLLEVARRMEKRRDNTNAERQARYRQRRVSNGVTVTGVTPPNDNILTPPCEEKPEPEGSVKKFVLPADIPADEWAAWVEMRRRIRKNPTDRAKTLAVAELRRLRDEEGWPPGDVLNHCTMNSYQGIFPPSKVKRNERTDHNPTRTAVERIIGSHG